MIRSSDVQRAAVLAAALTVWPLAAQARGMRLMESRPQAQAVMDGSSTEFFVRFDGPVDHRQSRLTVERNGEAIETLHPRLESAPEVLYANGGRLAPGAYALHWTVRSMTDREESEGTIPFTVR